jgi:hypothetical protein
VVNSLLDSATTGPGIVTLREAIIASEAHTSDNLSQTGTGNDTITFDPSLAGQTINLTQADSNAAFGPTALVITGTIAIDGPAGGITISGNSAERVFQVASGATLTLQGLTVTGGKAQGFDGAGGEGGGGGAAGMGGAIFNQGTLNLQASTITNSSAIGGNGGYGGGAQVGGGGGGLSGPGALGTAGGAGGATGGGSGGNKTAGQAGGFGGGGGGGGFPGFSGDGPGGAGGFGGGGGGGGGYSFTSGTGSAFGGGSSGASGLAGGGAGGGGGAGLGGAIFNDGGAVTITNSTFAGNTAQGGQGGTVLGSGTSGSAGSGLGGSIFSRNGTLTIINSTLSGNTAAQGGLDVYVLSDGTSNTATASVVNSILGQTDNTVTDFVANTNAGGNTPSLSGSNDLVRNNPATGGLPAAAVVSTADPLLAALANYGGPVPTMGLLPGSPAIDQGLDTTQAPYNLTTDQRGTGFPRKFGAAVDIGAFEFATYYYTVTSTADGAGTLTTTGHTGTAADPFQDITLRGAIAAATADHGVDTIVIAPSLFTSGPQTITLNTTGDNTFGPSDFGISTPITIVGPTGSNGLTLANSGSVTQRLFYISPAGSLTLQNLTLTGGKAGEGGGVYNAGMLSLANCALSGNSATGVAGQDGSATGAGGGGGGGAGLGGALFNATGGVVSVSNSTFSGNQAVGGQGGRGFPNNGVFAGSGGAGGGLNGGAGGTPGSAGGAGGFASGGGGGSGSAIPGGAGGAGGFGGGGGGGGGRTSGGTGGVGGAGGADGGAGSTAVASGAGGGGGGAGIGGAIFNQGTLTVVSTTIAGNSAAGGAGGGDAFAITPGASGTGLGGGIYADSGTVTLENTLIAGNTADAGPDVNGAITSQGYNLIGNTGGGSGFTGTDLVNVNPALGPLAGNGGPTQTMALLPGSPALASGTNVGAPTTDQRGFSRPDNVTNKVDIGAFQLQNNTLSITVVQTGPPVTTGGTATITVTVTNSGMTDLADDGSTVTVTLPTGLALASGSFTKFTIGALAAGKSTTFTTLATVTASPTVALTVTASVTSPDSNPNTVQNTGAVEVLTAQQRFIQALYLDDLGRLGSIAELNSWLPVLNGPGGQQAVATDITMSHEASDQLVKNWYFAYLGRHANGTEELGWVAMLQLGQSQEQVLSGILAGPEFYAHAQTLGFGDTADGNYVRALYQVLLNRSAGSSEVAGWLSSLPMLGRQGVALDILESTECRAMEVEGYYQELLHRPNDLVGIIGWVGSKLDLASIWIGMEASIEFFNNG